MTGRGTREEGATVAAVLTRAQENRALIALTLPVLLISMDATILGFAVPRLSEDLQPSSADLLWIIDVYPFVLSGLLITMGNVGDRIGRRRLLLYGAAGFSVTSLAAAFAPSVPALIAARAGMGVAGATLMPSTLSLIRNIFMDERRRQFAVAVWATMFSVGAVVGPIVGGLLLEHFWWGSVFLVGVPVTVAILVVGPLVIPESQDPDPAPFDVASSALSMAAILPLVYGMKTVAERGLDWVVAPPVLIGLVAGYAFICRQRRLPVPMIDLSLFAVPKFRVAITANLLTCFGFAGSAFFLTQYLQLVLGLSPTRAALHLLPGAVAGVTATMTAPALTRRFGTFTVIATGLAVGAVGFLLLTGLTVDSSVLRVVAALVVIETGLCAAITVSIDGIMTSVPPEKAGAGASVSETANELGVALGTAVLGSILTAVYRGQLTDAPAAAQDTLGAAHEVAEDLGGAIGDALVAAADAAFTDGIRLGSLVTALLLAAVSLASWRVSRR